VIYMEQRDLYNKLIKHTHPNNIKITIVNYDSKIDKYVPGKRYDVNKYKLYDERNVAVNEIIFDLDWRSYKANYQKAKLIIESMENRNIPYYICATGGKGIHIHTFFNKIRLSTDESKKLFREALSYGLSYKNIRLWLFNTILDEAGIDTKYRGKGKYVDSAPIIFNYYSGTTHLIRALGGRKYVKNTEGEWNTNYKTFIPIEEFKSKKIVVNNINNVKYPSEIPIFNINESEFCGFLNEYIKIQEKNSYNKLNNEKFDGKYIDLDGVLKIREGLSEGQRNAGASIIAIAARIDGLSKKEAYNILEEYVNNCSQAGSIFTIEEAQQWVNWIYNHDKPFWNCQLLKDLNLHEQNTCDFCKTKNKEALKFLTQTTMLNQIKEVLDYEIVGEVTTKMLVFLLMLSKNFPSSSGRPGWNIPNDPMSQNIIMSSDSASGKSWVIKRILELFGTEEDDYYIISRLTKNAINYFTDVNMDGKIVFIEEMQGLDDHTSQLRVWMSEGKLSLRTVEKVMNEEGQEVNVMVKKTTVGQPVFISNQAEGVIEDQLNNRSWILSMDVSEKQTSLILDYQDNLSKGVFKKDELKIRIIKDALQQLKPYHFIVPYSDNKAMGIPFTDVRSRRDYNKFITLIKCSAYLHQKQRKIIKDDNDNEYIVCDIKDYEIAKQYAQNVLGATFSGLTLSQIDLINNIKNSSWRDEFMISDLLRVYGKSQPHWYGMLKQLVDLGFISADTNIGKSTIYSINIDKAINIISLPSGEELLEKINKNSKIAPITPISKKDEIGNTITNSKFEKSPESKNQLIAVIGATTAQTKELLNYTPFKAPYINPEHLSIFRVCTNERFSPSKKVNNVSAFQGGKIIGATNRTSILTYMKKNTKHQIPYEDIQNHFELNDDETDKILDKLKSEGSIFECKPGRYMLL